MTEQATTEQPTEDTIVQVKQGRRWVDYARTTRTEAMAAVAAGKLPGHRKAEELRAVDWITHEEVKPEPTATTTGYSGSGSTASRTTMTKDDRDLIAAARLAGTTLAELKKAWPQYTAEQIREALPAPSSKAPAKQEPKTRTRKANEKPATTRSRRKGTGTRVSDEELAQRQAEEAKAAKGKAKAAPIDAKLAQRAVAMRAKLDDKGKPTSWAKVGFALGLAPEGAPKSQAGDAARRAYRQVKGENAPTGPSDY
jgi:hypothetical protein